MPGKDTPDGKQTANGWLLQILEKFGGPSPLADAEKSIINRDTTGETLYVDVRALWNTRNPELNVTLEPRDHIIIPMKKTMVIVAGEVNNAGVFPFQSSSIVSDYIKLAGGIDFEKGDILNIIQGSCEVLIMQEKKHG